MQDVSSKKKNLAILRKIKDGTLQWAATYHCKPVHSRKELFQSLPVEIQEQLGGEFDKDEILRTSGDFQRLAKQFYRKIQNIYNQGCNLSGSAFFSTMK